MSSAQVQPLSPPSVADKPGPDTPFTLIPLAGHIGAELRGLRLGGDLQSAVFAALKAALLRHKVLFIRGQQHLDDAQHEAFGRLFGELEAHPTVPAPSGTRLLELDSLHGGRADSWHTDVTFKPAFPQVSVLRAVVLPPHGGDTVWASGVAAYQGLPEPLSAWPKACAPFTAMTTTTRSAAIPPRRTRHVASTARSSAPALWRPSIRWCMCTPRPGSAPCCWAIS